MFESSEAYEEGEPAQYDFSTRLFYPDNNYRLPDIILSIMDIMERLNTCPHYGGMFPVIFEAPSESDCRMEIPVCATCDRFIIGNVNIGKRCCRSGQLSEFSNHPLKCTTGLSLCEACWEQCKKDNPHVDDILCRTCHNYRNKYMDDDALNISTGNNVFVVGRLFITRYWAPSSRKLVVPPPEWLRTSSGMDFSDYFDAIWRYNERYNSHADPYAVIVLVNRVIEVDSNKGRKRRPKKIATKNTLSSSRVQQNPEHRQRELSHALYRINCFYTKFNAYFLAFSKLWANHIRLLDWANCPVPPENLLKDCSATLGEMNEDLIAGNSPQAMERETSL